MEACLRRFPGLILKRVLPFPFQDMLLEVVLGNQRSALPQRQSSKRRLCLQTQQSGWPACATEHGFQECVRGLYVYSNMLAVGSEKADGALIAPHENLKARQAVSVEV